VDSAPNTDYAYWVSQNVFSMYQLMFRDHHAGAHRGCDRERMKFSAIMAFIIVWMFVVSSRSPTWCGVSRVHERPSGTPARPSRPSNFAGGTVVHMSSGWSALILCLIPGPAFGFGKTGRMPPHSMVLMHGRHRHALGRLVWL